MSILMNMESVIYKILCSANNHYYVGSSCQFTQRRATHLRKLRQQVHENPHLQNCYNKYGPESLVFSILESCETDRLLEREQHYIDNPPNGGRMMNINLTTVCPPKKITKLTKDQDREIADLYVSGSSSLDIARKLGTTKHRVLCSLQRSNVVRRDVHGPKPKTFTVVSPTGQIVEGENVSDFCRAHNLTRQNFVEMLEGKRKSVSGWKNSG